MSRSGAGERGAASLVVTVLAGLLTVGAVVTGILGGLLVDQRRVGAAADLAALAGATAVQEGRDGCPEAGRVAALNGAELTACSVAAERVRVRVARTVSLPLVGPVQLGGDAYAGPRDAS